MNAKTSITRQMVIGAVCGMTSFSAIAFLLSPELAFVPPHGFAVLQNPLSGLSFVTISSGPKLLTDAGLPTAESSAVGQPLRLKIPAIRVDAPVVYVGLTVDGSMDVPADQQDVAWLQLGTRPGESGSAVMAGHYGFKDKKPSVFDDLYKLHKGDKVYIEDDHGASISFEVRELKRYISNANAAAIFSSTDGNSHLNLITCEGEWNTSVNAYPERLVVFTDKATRE